MQGETRKVKSVTLASSPASALRRTSLGAVLSFAWNTDVFTASDALGAAGLTRSTTIDVIEELVDLGLLHELPNARAVGEYQKGRPARRFEFASDAAVVVGIDVAPDRILTIVSNLRGATLALERSATDLSHDSPNERRAAATSAVDRALRAAGRSRADVLALCAAVPAPVNADGASPPHRTGFWRRMNPDLVELFSWVPLVRVMNDASLAAVAEGSVGAAAGLENYVTVISGEFLGAGAVVDGNVLRGAHGGVAEMVAFDHVSDVGDADGLWAHAARWARDAAVAREIPASSQVAALTPDTLGGAALFALARDGDPDAERIVQRTGHALTVITGVLGSLFDPTHVVLAGMPPADAAQVVTAARDSVQLELDLPAPTLVASDLGVDVVCIGAVSAALDAARTGVLDLGERWRGGR